MSDGNNLKLNVTNFGPIAEAEIDLRPLTVFVGPSNTGKSYLAILIYALHRSFNGDAVFLKLRDSTIAASAFFAHGILQHQDSKQIPDKDTSLLLTWAKQIQHQLERDKLRIDIPDNILHIFRSALSLPGFEHVATNEIMRCFNVEDTRRLIRHNCSKNSTITVKRRQSSECSSELDPLTYKFIIGRGGVKYDSSIAHRVPERISGELDKIAYDDTLLRRLSPFDLDVDNTLTDDDREFLRTVYGIPRYAAAVLFPVLAHIFGSVIVKPLNRIAYYLPADRAGVMHAHRVVVSSLISRASHAGLRPERPRANLSGVMADFLETLISLSDLPTESHSPYHKISALVEAGMLRGAIRSEGSEIGYPIFSYQPEGWNEDIPLVNSSSMVSELAPVVLYLRHVVKPGDVLIIEEPESHLHPAMQVEFIRQLAAAVRSGVRVMLTTHSEWVLEELANLVRLSDLPEPQRDRVGGTDAGLTPERGGRLAFRSERRGRWFDCKRDSARSGNRRLRVRLRRRCSRHLQQMGEDRQPDRRNAQWFMTNLVDKIKRCMPSHCLATRCRRNGCSVDLQNAPKPCLLIDMDTGLVGENDSKCDYIFIGGTDDVWVVPIELKRGSAEARNLVDQLRAGARFAEMICKGEQVRFVPVLACRGIKRAQRQELRKKSNRIAFRGRPVEVALLRCRGLLNSVLS